MSTKSEAVDPSKITMDDNKTDVMEMETETEKTEGTRVRKQTEKGLSYTTDNKIKELNRIFKQLKKNTEVMTSLMGQNTNTETMRSHYSKWLTEYENFLSVFQELSQPSLTPYIDENTQSHNEDKDIFLNNFKTKMENWFADTSPGSDVLRLRVKSSKASSMRSRSLASSISSERLRQEEKGAELHAKVVILKEKQRLEMAKLELKMKEDELQLREQLAIVNAKKEVLDKFQLQEQERNNDMSNLIEAQKIREINLNSEFNQEPSTSVPNVLVKDNMSLLGSYVNPIMNAPVMSAPIVSEPIMSENVERSLIDKNNQSSHVLDPNAMSFQPVYRNINFTSTGLPDNLNMQTNVVRECNPNVYSSLQNVLPASVSGHDELINNSSQENAIATVVRHLKCPIVDLRKFDGDPFEYRRFIRQFETKVVVNTDTDEDRITYLEQFTTGEPHKIVKVFGYLPASKGYPAALRELEERYGDDEVIANEFVKRTLNWQNIKADNPKALDEFAIFLSECDSAVNTIQAVQVLEYVDNMKRIVAKLPFYCHDKWRSIIQHKKAAKQPVKFHDLVMFVKMEAKKANDPIYGKEALSLDHKAQTKPKLPVSRVTRSTFATNVESFTHQDSKSQPTYASHLTTQPKLPMDRITSTQPAYHTPCMYCNNQSHSLSECSKIMNNPYNDRVTFLKEKALCYGCLRVGHRTKFCRNRATCKTCNNRHPSVLHTNERIQREKSINSDKGAISACAEISDHTNLDEPMGAGNCEYTMSIVPVNVRLRNGITTLQTYAFLDPGSSVSFCSDNLMNKLGANGRKLKIKLETMSSSCTLNTFAIDGLEVSDINNRNVLQLPRVYSKDKMPVSLHHIPTQNDIAKWKHLSDVTLPHINAGIDLLIGNNVPDAYSPIQVRTGERGSPHATETLLGWIMWNCIRPVEGKRKNHETYSVNRIELQAFENVEESTELDKRFREFVNLDFPERHTFDSTKQPSQEDKRFLHQVEESIRTNNGHFEIGLPFRNDNVVLPNNEPQVRNRLRSLKTKFIRNPKFFEDYKTFMAKILEAGYAEQVPPDELARNDGKVWYIPHHGVYHPKKPSKIRVVFDCSAKFYGISLNKLLLPGPNLTNSLIGVLLRFRQENIAIMGDVEAMFHQVKVPKKDVDCFRFIWWPEGDLDQEPVVYRMVVHLFGAVSSPSCANSALRETAKQAVKCSPDISKIIEHNFYVDDCLLSCETEQKAITLIKNISKVCENGGFHVTKWVSSSPSVIESIPVEERANGVKRLDFETESLPIERALGIQWDVENDCFGFQVNLKQGKPTRRSILSNVCTVFDPLGFTAPYILTAKILLQDLCSRNLDWDEDIDAKDMQKWERWLSGLSQLEKLQIPRCYKPSDFGPVESCEIHIFSDASNIGYGIVSYLRLIDVNGRIHVSFLLGKARVAPLKHMTIPRMELTAAVIAVRVSKILLQELEYSIPKIVFWTDSTSVLQYIANEATRFRTFVANRITEIRELTCPDQWHHIDGKNNPADLASRGIAPNKFLSDTLWLKGPGFLWTEQSEWPKEVVYRQLPEGDPEVKNIAAVVVTDVVTGTDRLIEYFSDWNRLKRATAWLLKAMSNLKSWVELRKATANALNPGTPGSFAEDRMKLLHRKHMESAKQKMKSEHLATHLLQQAERVLIVYTQKQHFRCDIESLSQVQQKSKTAVSKTILKLDPFVENGILLVGGRLRHASICNKAKFPILLPKDSSVSKLIINDCHKRIGHLGKYQMLSTLRQRYWIIGASVMIKTLLSKCVLCRRYRAKGGQQKMSDLPPERLQAEDPPFTHTGMDYFGPLEIKRGRSIVKRYGVLFTCLTTRAVHLEVAYSLDTDSCVNAIRRFLSRRGPVKFIRSDNGTNLVGSEREMREALQEWNTTKIQKCLQQDGIHWEFNPPTASHFGGIWERMIRSTRKILHSLLKEQGHRMNEESLHTLLCEVESILNSRPLTELSDHPGDLEPLTPNHLLKLRAGENLPPGLFQQTDNFTRRKWRQVQYLANVFWTRWVKEYLPLLQLRQKWNYPKRNIQVDDIVLLIDNSPRNSWTLGRVVEVYKDKQGLVRSARVRTPTNVLDRPISKLCLILETND